MVEVVETWNNRVLAYSNNGSVIYSQRCSIDDTERTRIGMMMNPLVKTVMIHGPLLVSREIVEDE